MHGKGHFRLCQYFDKKRYINSLRLPRSRVGWL